MISVIIPVYNAQEVLSEAIESVLNQSYRNFELLLVDDGSTDASPSICDSFALKDDRVRVIHKKNGGVSSARNCGLDAAKGELISFVDNDDLLYPDFLDTMVNSIGNYDFLLASYVDGGGQERANVNGLRRKREIERVIEANSIEGVRKKAKEFRLAGFGVIWCTLFRKEILDKYHIRFHQLQHEDTLFIYEYVSHCNNLRKIIYEGYFRFYRDDSLGHSHKYIAENQAIMKLDDVFYEVIRHFNIQEPEIVNAFKKRLRAAIISYLFKGYYSDTKVEYKKRVARWKEMSSMRFKLSPFYAKLSFVDKTIYLILRGRLYFLVDPLLLGLTCFHRF